MIEVEIKCKLTPQQETELLNGATLISDEHLTDVYYDSATYELSLKDFWLRTRNNKFVLKIPAAACAPLSIQANTPKHELEDEQAIRQALNLPSEGTFAEALARAGYKPLYTLAKTRRKYSKEGFIIDIDHATFEHLTFDLCEIELMFEKSEDVKAATEKLIAFAQSHGITVESVPGNLIALIKVVNPEHYRLLEQAHAARIKSN